MVINALCAIIAMPKTPKLQFIFIELLMNMTKQFSLAKYA